MKQRVVLEEIDQRVVIKDDGTTVIDEPVERLQVVFQSGAFYGPQGPQGEQGEPGPTGDTGPQGEPGQPGAPGVGVPSGGTAGQVLTKDSSDEYDTSWTTLLTRRYVHTQASASAAWSINHTLGGRPSVSTVDSSGTVVYGEVSYVSDSSVLVSFTNPFSGYAYLT